MSRGFEIQGISFSFFRSGGALLAALALPVTCLGAPASAPEICQAPEEKQLAESAGRYFSAHLREHDRWSFSRPLGESARALARRVLQERMLDKRAELCAERLKLPAEIRNAAARYSSGECAAAATVEVVKRYAFRLATAFEENRKELGSIRDKHVQEIKGRIFEIARGSTAGLEGTGVLSLTQEAKVEWLKQQAVKLVGEAQLVWGGTEPERNPLIQQNLVFAREALSAKNEIEAMKKQLRTDGALPASCKTR